MKQNWKQFLTGGTSRQGTYAAGMTVVVIAIVIFLNLIVGQLPSNLVQFDITDNKLYTISNTSVDYLAKLDKKVDIIVVAEKGKVDDRITKFLDKYAALSKNITVSSIDPVTNPSVLSKYNISAGTLVVSCEETGKNTAIPFSDIIVYDTYSYYTTGNYTETQFDAEGQITGAVDKAVRNATTKVYTLEGHGETSLPSSAASLIDKANLLSDSVNLLTAGKVPDDCNLLIAYAPTKDLANDELTMLKNYLAGGGELLLMLDSDSLTNFKALMAEYGMSMAQGYIADTSRSYKSAYNLLPNISSASDITSGLAADSMALLINARGMTLTKPARDSITATSFLTTSDNGYAVTDDNNKIQGAYTLGATAVEKIGDNEEKTSRLTVITASSLLDPSITESFTNVVNLDIFMKAVSVDFQDVSNISVQPKSLQVTYNTVKNAGLWSLLFIFVIPLALLAGGFMYWLKRRKL